MKSLLKVTLLALLVVVNTSSPLAFDEDKAASNMAKTKAEAARKAQRQVKGRVLKVEQRGNVFRVKLLQASGRVVSIEIRKAPANRS